MPSPIQALVPRPSLKGVTADHVLAAELLSWATDAYLEGDLDLTRKILCAADIPALFLFGRSAIIREDTEGALPCKRRGTVDGLVRADLRMPSDAEKLALYHRDGWRCRYCGCRVISGRTRDVLRKAFPNEVPWLSSGPMHGGFFALSASLDPVVPHSKGGDNTHQNLVTSCWPCNFGMQDDSLEELGLSDPRLRPAVIDSWDGLTRLLARPAQPTTLQSRDPKRTTLRQSCQFHSSCEDRIGDC